MIPLISFQGYFDRVKCDWQGSVKGVMSGKHYNRSIYCHKIFNEALHRLRFSAFLESFGANAEEIRLFGQRIRGHFPDTEFDQDIFGKELESIMDQYKSFVSHEAKKTQPLLFGVATLSSQTCCFNF